MGLNNPVRRIGTPRLQEPPGEDFVIVLVVDGSGEHVLHQFVQVFGRGLDACIDDQFQVLARAGRAAQLQSGGVARDVAHGILRPILGNHLDMTDACSGNWQQGKPSQGRT